MTHDELGPRWIADVARFRHLEQDPTITLNSIASLAADLFNVPVAVINLIDSGGIWRKGVYGLHNDGVDPIVALCSEIIARDKPWIVRDAAKDPLTRDNPLVTTGRGFRFFAGIPLRSGDGFNLGALWVVDFKPRKGNRRQISRLEKLASVVVTELELQRNARSAEEVLKLHDARLRDWTESSADFPWELDESLHFTLCKTQKNIGRRHDFNKNESSATEWAKIEACYQEKRAFRNLDLAIDDENGEIEWIRVSGRPYFDDAGRFKGFRGVMIHVTAEKRIEHELQMRAKQQQGLAVLSQIALLDVTLENVFQLACDTLSRALHIDCAGIFLPDGDETQLVLRGGSGFDPDDIGRRAIFDFERTVAGRAFRSPEPLTVFDRAAANYVWNDSGTPTLGFTSCMAVGVGDIKHRFGVVMVGSFKHRKFTTDDESFLQAVAFVLGSVLGRRESMSKLRLRERALEAVGHGIVIADATSTELPILYVNAAVEHATQYQRHELIGKPSAFLFQESSHGGAAAIKTAIDHRGHRSDQINGKRRDGTSFPAELVTSRVLNEAGQVTHVVWVYSDIAQRLKLEADLRQAQKMEAIGKLTGGVAHDFNNLLTVILGNAEVASEITNDPDLKATAEVIIQAAERGADTVQRLLAFGRRQALEPEVFEVNQALESLAGLFHKLLGEEVALKSNLGTGRFHVHADKTQLETAIINLVVNARDAMPKGGVVSIETAIVDLESAESGPPLLPGSYVSIRIADTGCGMPSDVLERAFEPFFTTKDVGKGTGLGLSMVYGFAQQSGGHAQIKSEVGVGTTVEILIPETPQQAAAPAGETMSWPTRGRERVLVVEDQEDVRLFVTGQLRSLGYDVTSVADGPTALAHLRSERDIQLLFSDILLGGGIDGVEVAEEAAKLRPDLKVLFTSGYSDKAVERSNRFLDGSARLLKKPYRRAELAQALREALESTNDPSGTTPP